MEIADPAVPAKAGIQRPFEIIKIQSITALVVSVAGPALLDWLGISRLQRALLYVDVVASGPQVVVPGILNVFFYLDKRGTVTVTGLVSSQFLERKLPKLEYETFLLQ